MTSKKLSLVHGSFLNPGSTYPVVHLAFSVHSLSGRSTLYIPQQAHDSPFIPNNSTLPLGFLILITTTITQEGAQTEIREPFLTFLSPPLHLMKQFTNSFVYFTLWNISRSHSLLSIYHHS